MFKRNVLKHYAQNTLNQSNKPASTKILMQY